MHEREKKERVLKEAVSRFLEKESNRQSLITVTRVTLSRDHKKAYVFITVLPEEKERQALEFSKRKISDLINFTKKHARLRRIPFFEFVVDEGEKNRQNIEDLSQKNT